MHSFPEIGPECDQRKVKGVSGGTQRKLFSQEEELGSSGSTILVQRSLFITRFRSRNSQVIFMGVPIFLEHKVEFVQ